MNMQLRSIESAALQIGDHVGFVNRGESANEIPVPRLWLIRRCAPGRDAGVIRALALRSVAAWSPAIVRSVDRKTGNEAFRPHLGRRVVKPLLPGLIFVPDFEIANRFMESPADKTVPDLMDWLMVGPCNAVVSVDEMAILRAIVSAYNTPRSQRKASLGQLVRIIDGPFAHFCGRVDRLDSRGRLRVFVEALKRGLSVEVPESLIEPIEDTPRGFGSSTKKRKT